MVELPNKHLISRPINHLFPLEIPFTVNSDESVNETFSDEVSLGSESRNTRSLRKLLYKLEEEFLIYYAMKLPYALPSPRSVTERYTDLMILMMSQEETY